MATWNRRHKRPISWPSQNIGHLHRHQPLIIRRAFYLSSRHLFCNNSKLLARVCYDDNTSRPVFHFSARNTMGRCNLCSSQEEVWISSRLSARPHLPWQLVRVQHFQQPSNFPFVAAFKALACSRRSVLNPGCQFSVTHVGGTPSHAGSQFPGFCTGSAKIGSLDQFDAGANT